MWMLLRKFILYTCKTFISVSHPIKDSYQRQQNLPAGILTLTRKRRPHHRASVRRVAPALFTFLWTKYIHFSLIHTHSRCTHTYTSVHSDHNKLYFLDHQLMSITFFYLLFESWSGLRLLAANKRKLPVTSYTKKILERFNMFQANKASVPAITKSVSPSTENVVISLTK